MKISVRHKTTRPQYNSILFHCLENITERNTDILICEFVVLSRVVVKEQTRTVKVLIGIIALHRLSHQFKSVGTA